VRKEKETHVSRPRKCIQTRKTGEGSSRDRLGSKGRGAFFDDATPGVLEGREKGVRLILAGKNTGDYRVQKGGGSTELTGVGAEKGV